MRNVCSRSLAEQEEWERKKVLFEFKEHKWKVELEYKTGSPVASKNSPALLIANRVFSHPFLSCYES